MLKRVKQWVKENRPAFNFYILCIGVLMLGVVAIACHLLHREDLIDTAATVIGAAVLLAYAVECITYHADEWEQSVVKEH